MAVQRAPAAVHMFVLSAYARTLTVTAGFMMQSSSLVTVQPEALRSAPSDYIGVREE